MADESSNYEKTTEDTPTDRVEAPVESTPPHAPRPSVLDTGLHGSRRTLFFAIVAIAATGLDQLAKYLVFHHVPRGVQTMPVIPDVLWLSHVYNKGIAWGMLAKHPGLISLVAMATALVVLGCGLFGRFGWRTYILGLGCVFGGAVGNLIDRAVRPEGVLDFIDLSWWPQFNIADSAVLTGACLVALMILRATAIEDRAARQVLAETASRESTEVV
jgi:signal peptidase II